MNYNYHIVSSNVVEANIEKKIDFGFCAKENIEQFSWTLFFFSCLFLSTFLDAVDKVNKSTREKCDAEKEAEVNEETMASSMT